MAKPPIITITQTYTILPMRDPVINPYEVEIIPEFAWLPIRLTSGSLVWLRAVYHSKQLCESAEGTLYFKRACYNSEEYMMVKLKGEGNDATR